MEPTDIEPSTTSESFAPPSAGEGPELKAIPSQLPHRETRCLPEPLREAMATYEVATPLPPSSFPHPPTRPGGSPRPTLPNVAHLLRAHGVTVRYNVIKKKNLVTIPGLTGTSDNFDSVALTHITSLALLNGMDTGPIASSVQAIADQNPYNPVADWFFSRPWDERDRFPEFCETLTTAEDFPHDLKCSLLRRWLLSAVAAALEPQGFSCRGVLVLQGAQGIGKTKWAAALVSDAGLRRQVIKLGHHLDASDKDSQLSAITHWIVEIGELDGSLKKDIARLKGFITLDQDKIRPPYGRTPSEYPRRTVFCASVNDPKFLVDPTGNTRWWTLPVVSINYAHGIDMQQLFAQLAKDYHAGNQWWLTQAEELQLAKRNRSHQTESVIRELLLSHIDQTRIGDPKLTPRTSTEVLRAIGYDRPTNSQSKECCAALRDIIGEGKLYNGNMKWRVPLGSAAAVSIFDDDL